MTETYKPLVKIDTDRRWFHENAVKDIDRFESLDRRWKMAYAKSDKQIYWKTLLLYKQGDYHLAAAQIAQAIQSRPGSKHRLKLQREIEEHRQFEKPSGVIEIQNRLMPGPPTIKETYWCGHLMKQRHSVSFRND